MMLLRCRKSAVRRWKSAWIVDSRSCKAQSSILTETVVRFNKKGVSQNCMIWNAILEVYTRQGDKLKPIEAISPPKAIGWVTVAEPRLTSKHHDTRVKWN